MVAVVGKYGRAVDVCRAIRQKSDDLLLNILPEEVAEELKEKRRAQARLHDDVSVLFTDSVGFTHYSERLSPAQIIEELDTCFKHFDAIIERHGLEKIKTIGDAYMAVAGLPVPHPDGAVLVSPIRLTPALACTAGRWWRASLA